MASTSISPLEVAYTEGSASSRRYLESQFYYKGLPSCPLLVGRSSTTPWSPPSGPEAYTIPKLLGTVGNHPIKDVWEDNLSRKIIEYLDSEEVAWTSVDVVRISCKKEPFRPVILWIGVHSASLSSEKGTRLAFSCRDILIQSGILGVDVEIRDSRVTFLSGPQLLTPVYSSDPTVDVRNPLTATLGLPISCKLTSQTGTGGFYIDEGGSHGRLFLVTARHVLFEENRDKNETFEHTSTSASREILLFDKAAFDKFLESIQADIEGKVVLIEFLERRLTKVKDMNDSAPEAEHKMARDDLAKAKVAKAALEAFHRDVSMEWANPEDRVLGHVVYSPPLEFGFGKEQYTQDFAVIEIDQSKIDSATFEGNVIDLGTKINPVQFIHMMYPINSVAHGSKYPWDRLLRLNGTIPKEDIRHPSALDQNGEACFMVLKHGHGTGLTIGRANDVCSYIRHYSEDGLSPRGPFSKVWGILPFDDRSGVFASAGDSGALVVDGDGRIGGMITCGAGSGLDRDITYMTSIDSIMEGIQAKFPAAQLSTSLPA